MIACYIRVSTENQLENYSIEEQTERLKSYCKAKGYDHPKMYTDGGYSGGNIDRPALQELLEDIKSNLVTMVIVYKLDRLSRSQKDTLMLIEDYFLKNNVEFSSVCENFDTSTPFGRAMIGILSTFAQLEKDQITERFTMGRIGRAKEGLYHGGSIIPTGYDYVDGKLIVNEYEAMQVREVYDRFLKGQTIHGIWQHMKKTYTTKYGTWNSETLVRHVLKNSVYIGKVKFSGQEYDGSHEAIVDADTFSAVQHLFSSSSRNNYASGFVKTPFRAQNLLTGKIYCKRCGARFCGEHGNYTCYSRFKGSKAKIMDPNCKNKKWKIKELDEIILDQVKNMDFDEISYKKKSSPDANIITNKISEIDKQIRRMVDLYQIGTISIDEIKERTDKLRKEKQSLYAIMDNTGDELTPNKAESIRNKLLSLDEKSLDEKRLLLSYLIDRIEIDGDDVEIISNF